MFYDIEIDFYGDANEHAEPLNKKVITLQAKNHEEARSFAKDKASDILMQNNSKFTCFEITWTKISDRVKESWCMPTILHEDYKPVAFFYKNGVIDLDFFSEENCDYLSEYEEHDFSVEFPFIDEVKPTVDDWEALGFDIHYE